MKLKVNLIYVVLFGAPMLVGISCQKKDKSSKLNYSTNRNPATSLMAEGEKQAPLDIYFLIGQSNMAGRAKVTRDVIDTLNNVFLFTGSAWVKAANPLNKFSNVRKSMRMQKLGPGYTFAQMLVQKTGHTIGLVVNARGGTSVEQWQKGYTGEKDVNLYEHSLQRIQKAQAYGTVRAIIWHQGESDQHRSSTYLKKVKKLVQDFRTDIGAPDLILIAGQIGRWKSSFRNMNNVIKQIPENIDNADYVDTDGLTPLRGDSTNPHFDSRSQQVLGKRFAQKILNNIYK